jgi:hypothetical protein
MLQTVRAVVRDGKIELSEQVTLPKGASALVTILPAEEEGFWLEASKKSLSAVWDNTEDDAYAELLKG